MPASRSLTVALVLLLAPALAEAAPRANAPAAATHERPATPPKAAPRPSRPQAAASAPVQKTSHAAPAARPVPATSRARAPEPTRAADPGIRTPRPAADNGTRTPRPNNTAADNGTRTPRSNNAAVDNGTRTPRSSNAAVDNGTRTPRAAAVDNGARTPRTAPVDNGVRTPRPNNTAVDTGVRTPRPNNTAVDTGVRTPRAAAVDTGVRTPRPAAVDTGVRTPRSSNTAVDSGVRTPRPPRTPVEAPAAETSATTAPSTAPDKQTPANTSDKHAPANAPDTHAPANAADKHAPATAPDTASTDAPARSNARSPVPEASPDTRPPRDRDATDRPADASDDTAAHSAPPAPATRTAHDTAAPAPHDRDTARAAAPVPEASPPAPVPEASPDPTPTPTRTVPTRAPAAPDSSPLPPRSATPRQAPPAPPALVQAAPAKPARTATKPQRLRPQREPLLARHPAASCELDPLEAVGQSQHQRTRESLREFYWSDMARFFETTLDASEPTPRQADDPAFYPAADVIGTLPSAVRPQLQALATARTVDRLSGRSWTKIHKLLSSLGPAEVAALLRADSPTLRAHVWTWMSTTRTGGCHLGHVDLDFLEAAVADRSIAVEHGDDLVYRSLGDYALEARARLATLDPVRFDGFLARLTAAAEVDPLVRATAHGILIRRAHWDTLDRGLRDPSASVRAATAVAAAEMNRDRLEARLVEHAAADPADLVTEQIVGTLLGVHDPHNHGKPQLRGLLATTKDERLLAAVARWRGRGDALAPLPVPARPLRFTAAPVPQDSPAAPVPQDSPVAPAQRPSGASPAALIHAREQQRSEPALRDEPARPIPGIHDDDDDDRTIRIPPVRP